MVRSFTVLGALVVTLLGTAMLLAQTPAKKDMSMLCMLTLPQAELRQSATYKTKKGEDRQFGPHLVVPANATHFVVFSDRPHRVSKTIPGGIKAFTAFFHRSDLKVDHPNVTFAGHHLGTDKENYTVFKMSSPFILHKDAGKDAGKCVLPLKVIGKAKMPAAGQYKDVSLVVDNFWDWLAAGASAVATVLACGPGEALTVGLDTPACAASVAATVAALGNTLPADGP